MEGDMDVASMEDSSWICLSGPMILNSEMRRYPCWDALVNTLLPDLAKERAQIKGYAKLGRGDSWRGGDN